jgi:hypothetical protein
MAHRMEAIWAPADDPVQAAMLELADGSKGQAAKLKPPKEFSKKSDCPLANAARPSGLPLLCYYGVQSGMLRVECICGRGDAVAPLWNRCCELFPRATLVNQWHARGREWSMFISLIW